MPARGRQLLIPSASRSVVLAVAILLVGLAIYLPGLNGPLFFDDKPALTGNDRVLIDGSVMDQWRTAAFSSNSGPLHRPIAMLSFAANHALAGDFSPTGVKAVNLSVHLAIAGLLYGLFVQILTSLRLGSDSATRQLLAVTAAAIWMLHPLNVSTVLYAVQRMTQLAAFFVLFGLWVFMRYRQRWAEVGAGPGEVLAAGLWLLLLTALAVLSKESGALLPWLIIVLEVGIFRGIWAGQPKQHLRSAGWIVLLLPIGMVLAVLAVSPESLTGGYAGREFTLGERLLTQARLLWRYLGWICLPNINDMGFYHDDIPLSTGLLTPVTTVLALGGWLIALVVSFLLRNRFPLLLLAVLFFLVGHSMESTVIPLEMVFEHRNYLPAALVCLALASVLIVPASRSTRLSVWYPLLGVIAVLCLLLFVRVQIWSDELTLGRINLVHHPESPRSNQMYANALLRQLRDDRQSTLGQRERDVSLLLSRHYFERMYQIDNRDVAALVMLVYLDNQFFIQMQNQVDWLTSLDDLLNTRILQPTDWNALDLFFDLAGSRADMASEAQAMRLLDLLSERYPHSADVLRYRYQYLSRVHPESIPVLLPLLLHIQKLAPGEGWVYYLLLREQARSRDIPGMYEAAREWLLYDKDRHYINQVKSLFISVESGAETSDD